MFVVGLKGCLKLVEWDLLGFVCRCEEVDGDVFVLGIIVGILSWLGVVWMDMELGVEEVVGVRIEGLNFLRCLISLFFLIWRL